MTKRYFVYIMSNYAHTLYIGITNDLMRRVTEHKEKVVEGFTKRYNMTVLVYFEETTSVESAILREKQLKGWRRARKLELIESMNPLWIDLSEGLE